MRSTAGRGGDVAEHHRGRRPSLAEKIERDAFLAVLAGQDLHKPPSKLPALQKASTRKIDKPPLWDDHVERRYHASRIVTSHMDKGRKALVNVLRRLNAEERAEIKSRPKVPEGGRLGTMEMVPLKDALQPETKESLMQLDDEMKLARKQYLEEKCRVQRLQLSKNQLEELVPQKPAGHAQERERFLRRINYKAPKPTAKQLRVDQTSESTKTANEPDEKEEQRSKVRKRQKETKAITSKSEEHRAAEELEKVSRVSGDQRQGDNKQSPPKEKYQYRRIQELHLESLNINIDDMLGEGFDPRRKPFQPDDTSKERHSRVQFAFERSKDHKAIVTRSVQVSTLEPTQQGEQAECEDSLPTSSRERRRVRRKKRNATAKDSAEKNKKVVDKDLIPAYLLKKVAELGSVGWLAENMEFSGPPRYDDFLQPETEEQEDSDDNFEADEYSL